MKLLPNARKKELTTILDQIKLQDRMVLVDIPSGGNYLKQYLPDNIKILPLETSEIFAKLGNSPLCDWSKLPLEDQSVDAILCCAAIHHVADEDRKKFRQEAVRVLKKGGKLVIADVEQGTPMDPFLNEFVHNNNSLGHVGMFIDTNFAQNFAQGALNIVKNQYQNFTWEFSSNLEESMVYMKLLFGIDKASIKEVAKYMAAHLNLTKNNSGNYTMDWGLRYVTFEK